MPVYQASVNYEEGDMDPDQLRELIKDVLEEMDLYSESAVELLMMTACQESHCGRYIKQLGGGPALGIFQMEPATHSDLWMNYLVYKRHLVDKINHVAGTTSVDDNLTLRGNLIYQIAMARIHYLRVPERLPRATDVEGMARYWKKYYNTYLGKGTVEEAVGNYRRYGFNKI